MHNIDTIYISSADTQIMTAVANTGTMHNILRRNGINPVKVGGRWMYYRKDIEALMAKSNVQELLMPRMYVQKVVGNHVEMQEVSV